MKIHDAQADMRRAYLGGGAGVLVSSLVWLAAGMVAVAASPMASIATIFIGGMAIHPGAIAVSRLWGRSGAPAKSNPLNRLGLESVFMLFAGLFLAFAVAQRMGDWFFPVLLVAIGARYFVFSTMYGLRLYWALGAALCAAGMYCLIGGAPFYYGAFAGGAIELGFAAALLGANKAEA